MKSNYIDYSDEELLDRYRDGDNSVADYLVGKYKNLVRFCAKEMYILGGDNDDLIQEGMIGLFKAVQDFDLGRDTSFQTFAQLCVKRQMYTAIQAAGRQKHLPLNSYLSLCRDSDDAEYGGSVDLSLEMPALRSPEDEVVDNETVQRLEAALDRELSELEKQVLDLMKLGIGYVEMAHILGRSEKSVDNAIQRIKQKMKTVLKREKEEQY